MQDIQYAKVYHSIVSNLLHSGTKKYLSFEQFKYYYDRNGISISNLSSFDIFNNLKLTPIHNEIPYIKKYIHIFKSAMKRDIKFNISYDEFKSLYKHKYCFYTEKKLKEINISIDRVDNNKGYVSGNCVVCDRELNARKNNLSIPDIEIIYNGILKHQSKYIKPSILKATSKIISNLINKICFKSYYITTNI